MTSLQSLLAAVLIISLQNCNAQKSPSITYISPNQVKNAGELVKLDCSVKDASDYPAIWKKIDAKTNQSFSFSLGSSLIHMDYRFSIYYDVSSSTYTLQIRSVEQLDEGTYYCEIARFTPVVSASVDLRLRRPPLFSHNSTRSIVAEEGEDVQLECFADGYPPPTIYWRRQGKEVLQTGSVIYHGNVLSINSIQKRDGGIYYCVADNKVGRGIRHSANVAVEFAPVVTVSNSTVSQALDHDVNLACHVEAYPPPDITWLKNGVALSYGSRRHSISHFSTTDDVTTTILTINTIQKTQYGKYVCKAANKLGIAEGEVELLESSKPHCISFCDEDNIEDDNTTLSSNTTDFES